MADVVIVGAGVMGLMAARELAAAGSRVILLERGEAAREASWAGGGIVSPLYPWRYLDPITALASWSQGRYLELARELERETGLSPELRQKGLLMLSVDDEAEALRWADRHQRPLTRIGADKIRALEPHIRIEREQGLWMPEVASIRNPRLGRALRRSIELNPSIELVSNAEVTRFDLNQGRVDAVETMQGRFRAGQFLVCGGAWSGGLMETLGLMLAVEPVKGQMLLFNNPQHDASAPLLDRVVLADGRYLIPREDGRILVGSTLERVGFDKQTSIEARESLYQSALSMLPALQDCTVEAQWAGLRPGSPDGVPYIGAAEGMENLFLNAGHFRNGLVLAPASCRLIADLMLGRTPEIDPAPYRWSLLP
ncbi:glycine oxidase ThiO [Motiliproteus coralliicola]|uniref:Glycine oxidase ThiO n=1 Tax=Motiliproteus coralliicola TaxID=2283196 RepID=A0A369W9N5_9GAMM|nr:glycine oxidase ThiO [Motiliproteus coralliicola]